jgi:hypothetical protein
VDIDKLIGIAKSIPKDKLKTESGVRQVIRDLGKRMGKSFSDKELDGYVSKFRRMAKTENVNSLMNKLSKKGVNKSQLDKIKNRLKK